MLTNKGAGKNKYNSINLSNKVYKTNKAFNENTWPGNEVGYLTSSEPKRGLQKFRFVIGKQNTRHSQFPESLKKYYQPISVVQYIHRHEN